MINIEYANAYSEVLEILKYIPEEDYHKIPKDKIALFEHNANKEYCITLFKRFGDKVKYWVSLNEQNVSKIAKGIIAILFRDYWATPMQRDKIISKQQKDRMQLERIKSENYCTDDIFRNKKQNNIKEETSIRTTSMIQYKESLFKKILNKIRHVFTR